MSDDDTWGGSETLLTSYDAARPRNAQTRIGPSGVDDCIRALAYRHHRVPPSDARRSAAEARLGTLIHLGFATLVESMGVPGYETEVEIPIPYSNTVGHADFVDRAARIVTDVKTMKDRGFTYVVTHGPRDSMWHQVEIYAYGLAFAENRPYNESDWTLRIHAINRETGEEAEFSRPADFEEGARLVAKLNTRQGLLDSSDPDDLDDFDLFPREGSGPGRGFPCDWCPWLSTCWGVGWAEEPLSPQAFSIANDKPAIAKRLGEYLDASAEEAAAKNRKADARAFLQGLPAADYEGFRLTWRGGGPGTAKPDVEGMEDALTAAGVEVPYLEPKDRNPTINVSRVPQAPTG